MEAALDRFRAANTQVLGVSVDSRFSHANWARDLGGVSFPLLADFQPKGGVAASFGHYLDGPGIGDRATVIIDKDGAVRFSESVTPAGKREVDALVAEAEKVAGDGAEPLAGGGALDAGATLYVKSHCGPSRSVLMALENLGASDRVSVRNVTEDTAAASELEAKGGKNQAPCLVTGGGAQYEAGEIVVQLANALSPLP